MAALTSSFAFNAIQLSVMSQKFVTYSAVIPGKPAIAARPGIQEIQENWIPAFAEMTPRTL
jgi:hypothetical protein